ncbi:oxidoreductase [Vibrio methylphosphonaticus]|uniref:oxidoreductase n=1 Tax=Vibrio methylphosphonaticus TaxID=2946866 RepID=UPI00202AA9C2|nr:oxidoreductase [Vibrio methylphosphonaticus]MCL9775538.1 oxidoreductase [Vibrio methylphosphonaticus]
MAELLTKKKIVVVGAGGLLGAQVVKGILKSGGEVIALDINVAAMKERFVSVGIAISEENIHTEELNINDSRMLSEFWENVENVSGAVNCTYPRNATYGGNFFDVTLDSFNENINLHLGSAFLFSQQCAKYFMRNDSSFALVNVSSVYGVIAPKFEIYDGTSMTMPVEYAVIKSAILHLNKYICAYVKNSKFRINSISPGGLIDSQPEEFIQAYKEQTNGTGMLKAEDMVESVIYLLSDSSKYVTGQNIVIDDGFTI